MERAQGRRAGRDALKPTLSNRRSKAQSYAIKTPAPRALNYCQIMTYPSGTPSRVEFAGVYTPQTLLLFKQTVSKYAQDTKEPARTRVRVLFTSSCQEFNIYCSNPDCCATNQRAASRAGSTSRRAGISVGNALRSGGAEVPRTKRNPRPFEYCCLH